MESVIDFVLGLFVYNWEIVFFKLLPRLTTRKPTKYFLVNREGILHISDNFLVVHKPYDLVINSNDPTVKETLQIRLRNLLPHLVNPTLPHEFYFVHRLDFATSGVICLALKKKASSAAASAFERRETKKYYIALLRGHLHKTLVDIDVPIGEDRSELNGNRRMCVSTDANCISPRSARTRLLVLQRGQFNKSPATKVLLRPITGRRHQLRVHCNAIGHTIIGDFTYSNRTDCDPYRMFLHAYRLVMPNCVEPLDVQTTDPFTNDGEAPQWQPTQCLNRLDDSVFQKLE